MYIKKLISLLVVITFMFNVVAQPIFASSNYELDYNLLKDFFVENCDNAKNKNKVILIQDLHCHYDVQKKISNFLDNIVKKENFNNIFVEGLNKNIKSSIIKKLPEEIKNPLLEQLIKEGKIGASEYFFLKSDKEIELQGLEKDTIYQDNSIKLKYIQESQEEVSKIILDMDSQLQKVVDKKLASSIKKVLKKHKEYENGKIAQDKYFKYLVKEAKKSNVLPQYYEEIEKFSNINTKINSSRVKKDLQQCMTNLKNKLPYSEYKQLLGNDVISKLLEMSKENKFDLKQYSELYKYINIQESVNKINIVNIYEQELELLNKIVLAQANEDILDLAILEISFNKFRSYMLNTCTAQELDYVENFNIDNIRNLWIKFLDEKYFLELSKYIDIYKSYHRVNYERNFIFVKKIVDDIKNKENKIDIVITGGFHTQTLKELLIDNELNVAVLTPKVNGNIKFAEDNYKKVFKEQENYDLTYNLINKFALKMYVDNGDKETLLKMFSDLRNINLLNNDTIKKIEDVYNKNISSEEEKINIEYEEKDNEINILIISKKTDSIKVSITENEIKINNISIQSDENNQPIGNIFKTFINKLVGQSLGNLVIAPIWETGYIYGLMKLVEFFFPTTTLTVLIVPVVFILTHIVVDLISQIKNKEEINLNLSYFKLFFPSVLFFAPFSTEISLASQFIISSILHSLYNLSVQSGFFKDVMKITMPLAAITNAIKMNIYDDKNNSLGEEVTINKEEFIKKYGTGKFIFTKQLDKSGTFSVFGGREKGGFEFSTSKNYSRQFVNFYLEIKEQDVYISGFDVVDENKNILAKFVARNGVIEKVEERNTATNTDIYRYEIETNKEGKIVPFCSDDNFENGYAKFGVDDFLKRYSAGKYIVTKNVDKSGCVSFLGPKGLILQKIPKEFVLKQARAIINVDEQGNIIFESVYVVDDNGKILVQFSNRNGYLEKHEMPLQPGFTDVYTYQGYIGKITSRYPVFDELNFVNAYQGLGFFDFVNKYGVAGEKKQYIVVKNFDKYGSLRVLGNLDESFKKRNQDYKNKTGVILVEIDETEETKKLYGEIDSTEAIKFIQEGVVVYKELYVLDGDVLLCKYRNKGGVLEQIVERKTGNNTDVYTYQKNQKVFGSKIPYCDDDNYENGYSAIDLGKFSQMYGVGEYVVSKNLDKAGYLSLFSGDLYFESGSKDFANKEARVVLYIDENRNVEYKEIYIIDDNGQLLEKHIYRQGVREKLEKSHQEGYIDIYKYSVDDSGIPICVEDNFENAYIFKLEREQFINRYKPQGNKKKYIVSKKVDAYGHLKVLGSREDGGLYLSSFNSQNFANKEARVVVELSKEGTLSYNEIFIMDDDGKTVLAKYLYKNGYLEKYNEAEDNSGRSDIYRYLADSEGIPICRQEKFENSYNKINENEFIRKYGKGKYILSKRIDNNGVISVLGIKITKVNSLFSGKEVRIVLFVDKFGFLTYKEFYILEDDGSVLAKYINKNGYIEQYIERGFLENTEVYRYIGEEKGIPYCGDNNYENGYVSIGMKQFVGDYRKGKYVIKKQINSYGNLKCFGTSENGGLDIPFDTNFANKEVRIIAEVTKYGNIIFKELYVLEGDNYTKFYFFNFVDEKQKEKIVVLNKNFSRKTGILKNVEITQDLIDSTSLLQIESIEEYIGKNVDIELELGNVKNISVLEQEYVQYKKVYRNVSQEEEEDVLDFVEEYYDRLVNIRENSTTQISIEECENAENLDDRLSSFVLKVSNPEFLFSKLKIGDKVWIKSSTELYPNDIFLMVYKIDSQKGEIICYASTALQEEYLDYYIINNKNALLTLDTTDLDRAIREISILLNILTFSDNIDFVDIDLGDYNELLSNILDLRDSFLENDVLDVTKLLKKSFSKRSVFGELQKTLLKNRTAKISYYDDKSIDVKNVSIKTNFKQKFDLDDIESLIKLKNKKYLLSSTLDSKGNFIIITKGDNLAFPFITNDRNNAWRPVKITLFVDNKGKVEIEKAVIFEDDGTEYSRYGKINGKLEKIEKQNQEGYIDLYQYETTGYGYPKITKKQYIQGYGNFNPQKISKEFTEGKYVLVTRVVEGKIPLIKRKTLNKLNFNIEEHERAKVAMTIEITEDGQMKCEEIFIYDEIGKVDRREKIDEFISNESSKMPEANILKLLKNKIFTTTATISELFITAIWEGGYLYALYQQFAIYMSMGNTDVSNILISALITALTFSGTHIIADLIGKIHRKEKVTIDWNFFKLIVPAIIFIVPFMLPVPFSIKIALNITLHVLYNYLVQQGVFKNFNLSLATISTNKLYVYKYENNNLVNKDNLLSSEQPIMAIDNFINKYGKGKFIITRKINNDGSVFIFARNNKDGLYVQTHNKDFAGKDLRVVIEIDDSNNFKILNYDIVDENQKILSSYVSRNGEIEKIEQRNIDGNTDVYKYESKQNSEGEIVPVCDDNNYQNGYLKLGKDGLIKKYGAGKYIVTKNVTSDCRLHVLAGKNAGGLSIQQIPDICKNKLARIVANIDELGNVIYSDVYILDENDNILSRYINRNGEFDLLEKAGNENYMDVYKLTGYNYVSEIKVPIYRQVNFENAYRSLGVKDFVARYGDSKSKVRYVVTKKVDSGGNLRILGGGKNAFGIQSEFIKDKKGVIVLEIDTDGNITYPEVYIINDDGSIFEYYKLRGEILEKVVERYTGNNTDVYKFIRYGMRYNIPYCEQDNFENGYAKIDSKIFIKKYPKGKYVLVKKTDNKGVITLLANVLYQKTNLPNKEVRVIVDVDEEGNIIYQEIYILDDNGTLLKKYENRQGVLEAVEQQGVEGKVEIYRCVYKNINGIDIPLCSEENFINSYTKLFRDKFVKAYKGEHSRYVISKKLNINGNLNILSDSEDKTRFMLNIDNPNFANKEARVIVDIEKDGSIVYREIFILDDNGQLLEMYRNRNGYIEKVVSPNIDNNTDVYKYAQEKGLPICLEEKFQNGYAAISADSFAGRYLEGRYILVKTINTHGLDVLGLSKYGGLSITFNDNYVGKKVYVDVEINRYGDIKYNNVYIYNDDGTILEQYKNRQGVLEKIVGAGVEGNTEIYRYAVEYKNGIAIPVCSERNFENSYQKLIKTKFVQAYKKVNKTKYILSTRLNINGNLNIMSTDDSYDRFFLTTNNPNFANKEARVVVEIDKLGFLKYKEIFILDDNGTILERYKTRNGYLEKVVEPYILGNTDIYVYAQNKKGIPICLDENFENGYSTISADGFVGRYRKGKYVISKHMNNTGLLVFGPEEKGGLKIEFRNQYVNKQTLVVVEINKNGEVVYDSIYIHNKNKIVRYNLFAFYDKASDSTKYIIADRGLSRRTGTIKNIEITQDLIDTTKFLKIDDIEKYIGNVVDIEIEKGVIKSISPKKIIKGKVELTEDKEIEIVDAVEDYYDKLVSLKNNNSSQAKIYVYEDETLENNLANRVIGFYKLKLSNPNFRLSSLKYGDKLIVKRDGSFEETYLTVSNVDFEKNEVICYVSTELQEIFLDYYILDNKNISISLENQSLDRAIREISILLNILTFGDESSFLDMDSGDYNDLLIDVYESLDESKDSKLEDITPNIENKTLLDILKKLFSKVGTFGKMYTTLLKNRVIKIYKYDEKQKTFDYDEDNLEKIILQANDSKIVLNQGKYMFVSKLDGRGNISYDDIDFKTGDKNSAWRQVNLEILVDEKGKIEIERVFILDEDGTQYSRYEKINGKLEKIEKANQEGNIDLYEYEVDGYGYPKIKEDKYIQGYGKFNPQKISKEYKKGKYILVTRVVEGKIPLIKRKILNKLNFNIEEHERAKVAMTIEITEDGQMKCEEIFIYDEMEKVDIRKKVDAIVTDNNQMPKGNILKRLINEVFGKELGDLLIAPLWESVYMYELFERINALIPNTLTTTILSAVAFTITHIIVDIVGQIQNKEKVIIDWNYLKLLVPSIIFVLPFILPVTMPVQMILNIIIHMGYNLAVEKGLFKFFKMPLAAISKNIKNVNPIYISSYQSDIDGVPFLSQEYKTEYSINKDKFVEKYGSGKFIISKKLDSNGQLLLLGSKEKGGFKFKPYNPQKADYANKDSMLVAEIDEKGNIEYKELYVFNDDGTLFAKYQNRKGELEEVRKQNISGDIDVYRYEYSDFSYIPIYREDNYENGYQKLEQESFITKYGVGKYVITKDFGNEGMLSLFGKTNVGGLVLATHDKTLAKKRAIIVLEVLEDKTISYEEVYAVDFDNSLLAEYKNRGGILERIKEAGQKDNIDVYSYVGNSKNIPICTYKNFENAYSAMGIEKNRFFKGYGPGKYVLDKYFDKSGYLSLFGDNILIYESYSNRKARIVLEIDEKGNFVFKNLYVLDDNNNVIDRYIDRNGILDKVNENETDEQINIYKYIEGPKGIPICIGGNFINSYPMLRNNDFSTKYKNGTYVISKKLDINGKVSFFGSQEKGGVTIATNSKECAGKEIRVVVSVDDNGNINYGDAFIIGDSNELLMKYICMNNKYEIFQEDTNDELIKVYYYGAKTNYKGITIPYCKKANYKNSYYYVDKKNFTQKYQKGKYVISRKINNTGSLYLFGDRLIKEDKDLVGKEARIVVRVGKNGNLTYGEIYILDDKENIVAKYINRKGSLEKVEEKGTVGNLEVYSYCTDKKGMVVCDNDNYENGYTTLKKDEFLRKYRSGKYIISTTLDSVGHLKLLSLSMDINFTPKFANKKAMVVVEVDNELNLKYMQVYVQSKNKFIKYDLHQFIDEEGKESFIRVMGNFVGRTGIIKNIKISKDGTLPDGWPKINALDDRYKGKTVNIKIQKGKIVDIKISNQNELDDEEEIELVDNVDMALDYLTKLNKYLHSKCRITRLNSDEGIYKMSNLDKTFALEFLKPGDFICFDMSNVEDFDDEKVKVKIVSINLDSREIILQANKETQENCLDYYTFSKKTADIFYRNNDLENTINIMNLLLNVLTLDEYEYVKTLSQSNYYPALRGFYNVLINLLKDIDVNNTGDLSDLLLKLQNSDAFILLQKAIRKNMIYNLYEYELQNENLVCNDDNKIVSYGRSELKMLLDCKPGKYVASLLLDKNGMFSILGKHFIARHTSSEYGLMKARVIINIDENKDVNCEKIYVYNNNDEKVFVSDFKQDEKQVNENVSSLYELFEENISLDKLINFESLLSVICDSKKTNQNTFVKLISSMDNKIYEKIKENEKFRYSLILIYNDRKLDNMLDFSNSLLDLFEDYDIKLDYDYYNFFTTIAEINLTDSSDLVMTIKNKIVEKLNSKYNVDKQKIENHLDILLLSDKELVDYVTREYKNLKTLEDVMVFVLAYSRVIDNISQQDKSKIEKVIFDLLSKVDFEKIAIEEKQYYEIIVNFFKGYNKLDNKSKNINFKDFENVSDLTKISYMLVAIETMDIDLLIKLLQLLKNNDSSLANEHKSLVITLKYIELLKELSKDKNMDIDVEILQTIRNNSIQNMLSCA